MQHGIKKLRNGILSSGPSGTRMLRKDNNEITWNNFISIYKWDVNHNTVRYYEKLTDSHFFLDTSLKMRNHLADEVLNKRMLELTNELIKNNPAAEPELRGTVDLLQNTSKVVEIFRDARPITTKEDERLKCLEQFLKWMKDWESSTTDKKQLFSPECRKDWESTILGFTNIVSTILDNFPEAGIVPANFNTDILENTFGCQRGLVAGTGTNPTVLQYCKTINTITLTTNSVSGKSNAGSNSTALPFNFQMPETSYSVLQK